jgi:hypothetical protein
LSARWRSSRERLQVRIALDGLVLLGAVVGLQALREQTKRRTARACDGAPSLRAIAGVRHSVRRCRTSRSSPTCTGFAPCSTTDRRSCPHRADKKYDLLFPLLDSDDDRSIRASTSRTALARSSSRGVSAGPAVPIRRLRCSRRASAAA